MPAHKTCQLTLLLKPHVGSHCHDGCVSKLGEIIDAATGDTVPISSLLRLTKVLASRISNPTLLGWVDNELGGYPPDAELPDYRGPFPVAVRSDWAGPFGSYMRRMPMPSQAVPEGMRKILFEAELRQAVGELEPLSGSEDMLRAEWDADAIALLNSLMDGGQLHRPVEMHGLVTAYRMISPALLRAALDNIRTRVLNVALELEQLEPDAGEPGVQPPDPTAVTYAVTNNIYGHGNAVAVNSAGAHQTVKTVVKGDLQSLLKAAADTGLSSESVKELEDAVRGDEADEGPGKPGKRTREFMGKLVLVTGAGIGQLATGAGGSIIAELIQAYYGL